MVNDNVINLKNLNIDELAGVVNLYPWFGAARKELCLRMSRLGGWDDNEYAVNALYLASRKCISDIVRAGKSESYSDTDLHELLAAYTSGKEVVHEEHEEPKNRRVRALGGDFFSQDEYDSVRREEDNVFSSFAAKARSEEKREKSESNVLENFCTETLDQIFVEQGYYEQAKFIYSKLILRYPEKSAYFASLIDKLAQNADY